MKIEVIGKIALGITLLFAGLYFTAWLLYDLPVRRLEHLFPNVDWAFETVLRQYVILALYDPIAHWLMGVAATGILVILLWHHRPHRKIKKRGNRSTGPNCRKRQNQYWKEYFSS